MAVWTEAGGLSLLTGATDANSDTIRVRRIGGLIITTWPARVTLSKGSAIVTEAGVVTWDDAGASGIPAGTSTPGGSFKFTLWDGAAESPEYTATLSLIGANSAPVGRDQTLTFNVQARP